MKVLWITNVLFPDVCRELKIETPVVGGWMIASANALLETGAAIELAVASIYAGKEMKIMNFNNITYFLLPKESTINADYANLKPYWKQVKENFSPTIVHIHGTEYSYGLSYVKACGKQNVLVSIQGIVSIYERYYFGGISESTIRKNITLRDIIRKDTLFTQKKSFKQRGIFEKELIQTLNDIVGRTSWDKAHIWAINSNANYHFCNETLREEFYKHTWQYQDCEKYSIFLSQAHYPIKGLQQVIASLPIILKHYPDTKVYIAGTSFINKNFLKLNGFEKYICSLIKEEKLEDHIYFTGLLSEKEMCNRYLRSNVFVCPSSIENSPNSIGEAQLLGVPCIGSYVGGMSDLVEDGETGLLYRFEEVEMLAERICMIFSDVTLAQNLSEKSKTIAEARHNKSANAYRTVEIYNNIAGRKILN